MPEEPTYGQLAKEFEETGKYLAEEALDLKEEIKSGYESYIDEDEITKFIEDSYKEAKKAVKKDRNNDNEKSADVTSLMMQKIAKTH